MKKISFCLSILTVALLITSCGDDDSATPIVEEEKISIEDGNALTSAIKIQGSTVIKGNPPAPSTDPAAPVVDEGSDATAISGNNLIIPVYETSGSSVAGAYLKIKGSDSYYDIPASALGNAGGRTTMGRINKNKRNQKTNEVVGLNLELPAELEPGIFCVEYCVYDAQNRVSNIIEVCIEVLAFGGENSAFLTNNAWSLVSDYYKEIYSNQTYEETEVVGEDDIYTYTTSLSCGDGTYQDVEVEEIDRTNYLYVTFNAEGAMGIESSYYEKYMDYENSTCSTGVIYDEGTYVEEATAAWSYNDNTKELTLLFEDEWEDNGVAYSETYVEVYDVKLENNGMVLSYEVIEEDYYDYFEMTFKIKN